MSGILDPRFQGFDLGSSASVLNARMELNNEAEETQKAKWEALPQHVRDRLVMNVKMTMARKAIMNGPRGTPPRPSTLMRFVRQIERGTPPNKASYLAMSNGMYLHPTKGWRGSVATKQAA